MNRREPPGGHPLASIALSEHLRLRAPETEFERGVRRFRCFLMEVALVLVIAIFAVNVFYRDHAQHPVLQQSVEQVLFRRPHAAAARGVPVGTLGTPNAP